MAAAMFKKTNRERLSIMSGDDTVLTEYNCKNKGSPLTVKTVKWHTCIQAGPTVHVSWNKMV